MSTEDQNTQYQVPPPMEQGDSRQVPPLGDTTPAQDKPAPAEPAPAEEDTREKLPDGLEYVSDDVKDGVTFNTVPWVGY